MSKNSGYLLDYGKMELSKGLPYDIKSEVRKLFKTAKNSGDLLDSGEMEKAKGRPYDRKR